MRCFKFQYITITYPNWRWKPSIKQGFNRTLDKEFTGYTIRWGHWYFCIWTRWVYSTLDYFILRDIDFDDKTEHF